MRGIVGERPLVEKRGFRESHTSEGLEIRQSRHIGLRWTWALTLSLGMLGAGCNEILGNQLHSADLDATVEDAAFTDGPSSQGSGDGAASANQHPSANDAGGNNGAHDATPSGVGPHDGDAAATRGQTGDAAMESVAGDDAGGVTQGAAPPACIAGGACAPNDCQNGTWACTDAGRLCQETTPVANGTPCGSNGGDGGARVCSGGQCAECNAGGDCSDPAMPCIKKSYGCSSGAPVCAVTGNVADGTSCGTGLYCNGGACAACKVGAACAPTANPCHVGMITACTGGAARCTDQTTAASAGTSCTAAGGASGVCNGSGSCVACSAGTQCNPDGNMCSTGVLSCSAGPACQNAVAVNEGQTCGASQILPQRRVQRVRRHFV